MLNSSSPYLQTSANQMVDMVETLVDVYTRAAVILGIALLLLLVWLCISELRQSKKRTWIRRESNDGQPLGCPVIAESNIYYR